jgi:hypothetical protein
MPPISGSLTIGAFALTKPGGSANRCNHNFRAVLSVNCRLFVACETPKPNRANECEYRKRDHAKAVVRGHIGCNDTGSFSSRIPCTETAPDKYRISAD